MKLGSCLARCACITCVLYNKINYYFAFDIFLQLEEASDDQEMSILCNGNRDIIQEAGYYKHSVSVNDKDDLLNVLRLHYTLFRNIAVMDQLKLGMRELGLLAMMEKYQTILKPLFVSDSQQQLTAGMY